MLLMQNKLLAAALALALVSLVGCASVGNTSLRNENETTVAQKIVDGKTTEAEIRSMFGSPRKTSFTDNGLEIWTYQLSKMHAGAVDFIPFVGLFGTSASGTNKELVVLFNNSGIVEKYSMSDSPVSVRTGIFNR